VGQLNGALVSLPVQLHDLFVAGGDCRIHSGSPFAGIEASAYVDDVFGGIFPKSRKIFEKITALRGEKP
jgi:hypothetical protein